MGKEDYLAYQIKSLNNQIKRLMEKSAISNNDARLTGMQYGILGFLEEQKEHGDIYQRDIEAEFNIRRSTASDLVKGLEKNGYIRREGVPEDARLKKIIATEKAEKIHKVARAHINELNQRLVRGVSEEELKLFYTVLKKIKDNARD